MKFYPHVTDQMAHFLVAALLMTLCSIGGPIAGAFGGLFMGLIRELSEAGGSRISLAEVKKHFAKRDPWIDLGFWTLGGLVAGLVTSAHWFPLP